MKKYTPVLLLALAFIGCKDESVDRKKEGENLMQVSREWSQAAGTRDVDKTMGYWADDAIVVSAGEEPLRGKQEIRQMVEGSMSDPDFQISWEPQSAEISESGDLGYLLEETTIKVNDSLGNPVIQKFQAVTIWKKQKDGSWKNVVDVMSPKSVNY